MKWWTAGLILLTGFALLGFGQGLPLSDVVKVQALPEAAELPLAGSTTVTLLISVLPGWHINSPEPSGVLIPTEVSLSLPDGMEAKPTWPSPEKVKVSFSPEPLDLYRGEVEVPIRFTAGKDVPPGKYTIQGKLAYQACNDEVCLPPAAVGFTLSLTVLPPRSVPVGAGTPADGGSVVGRGLILGLITAFLLGLGLNLTPCVYPMIPIAVAYFSRQSEARVIKTIGLALSYQLGLALTYSALGVVAALSGGMLGELLQRSWMLALAAGVIAVFATSFLGMWHLRPPAILLRRLPRGRGGPLGAFLMGSFVGVIAAPCVGPVTAALLSYVASSQDAIRGGALFLALALGLGAPYVGLALLAGRFKLLPRVGPWTTWVERLMGVLLIALSWYLVMPLVPARAWLWGAAALAAGGAGYLFFVGRGIPGRVFRTLRWAVVLLGIALASFILLPEGTPPPSLSWIPYSAESFTQARGEERPILLYFSADWCLPCKELSVTTFRSPEVISATRGVALIKVDLTAADDRAAEEFRRSFEVVGVPTLVILGPGGDELWRNVGYITAADLVDAIQKTLRPAETDG